MEKVKPILLIRTYLSHSQINYLLKSLGRDFSIVFCPSDITNLEDRIRDNVNAIITHSLFQQEASVYPQLRFVQIYGRGTDKICLRWLDQHNIRYNVCLNEKIIDSIAEYLLGQILYWEQNLRALIPQAKAGTWSWEMRGKYSFRLLNQLTIGIIGQGFIGSGVGRYFSRLGLTCKYINVGMRMEEKDVELLSKVDYLSIHLRYDASTEKIIDKEIMKHLSANTVLLNASRGGVIDEYDLAFFLKNHLLRGASVDVTSVEPLIQNSPLWQCDRLVITPHIAGRAIPALDENIKEIVENIRNEFDLCDTTQLCSLLKDR